MGVEWVLSPWFSTRKYIVSICSCIVLSRRAYLRPTLWPCHFRDEELIFFCQQWEDAFVQNMKIMKHLCFDGVNFVYSLYDARWWIRILLPSTQFCISCMMPNISGKDCWHLETSFINLLLAFKCNLKHQNNFRNSPSVLIQMKTSERIDWC